MIKYNLNNINDWNFGEDNIIKVYRNNAVCYYKITSGGTQEFKVCYAVVADITQYTDREFEDVYDKATEKWYKLNNLNQYEEYGIYGEGRNITYYEGKLTVDDGYEYMYSGGSWVNLGEVTGGTASLPDVPFTVNYNAKNYNSSTKTLLKTEGQLANVDAVITAGTPTVHDGYLTIATNTRATISGYQTYFNRDNNNPNLTIISKQRTDGSNCHMFANRDNSYNWMYRPYSNYLTLHGTREQGQVAVTTQPVIESARVDSSRKVTYNNYTNNTTSATSSFSYGSANSGKFAIFQGYGTRSGENFVGDFYWVYMSQTTLTDEQVQQVIAYNEGGGGGQTEYPVYYDEKADPLDNLTFNTMEDAVDYAYNNCVYDGMKATIDGVRYYFDSSDENGWIEQTYTQYEYIRTQNAATVYYDFDTNFKPTTANTLEVKVEFVDRSIDWGHIVSWCDREETAYHNFEFQTVTASYGAIVRTAENGGTSYKIIGANNPTVFTLPLSAQSGTYSVNGGSTETIQYNYSTMILPAIIGMCFFGRGTLYREKAAVAKMYYVKVYDGNGNLVKHYVPSDYNGTPCFYEIVDKEYIMDTYTGSNHGTLTLGPEI